MTVVVIQGSDSGSDTLSQLAMEAGLERPQRRNSGLLGLGEGKERRAREHRLAYTRMHLEDLYSSGEDERDGKPSPRGKVGLELRAYAPGLEGVPPHGI